MLVLNREGRRSRWRRRWQRTRGFEGEERERFERERCGVEIERPGENEGDGGRTATERGRRLMAVLLLAKRGERRLREDRESEIESD